MRLARAWRPSSWQTIGALDRRGPLTVGIWRAHDFKRWSLPERSWIHSRVITALDLTISQDLRGNPILRDQKLSLDGLSTPLQLDLEIASASSPLRFPERLDVIISVRDLAEYLQVDSRDLSLTSSGAISAGQGPPRDSLNAEPPAHLSRFERWRPERSYPNLIVGVRIDEAEQTLIKWTRPAKPLPQDLWLLVDISPPGTSPQPIEVWIIGASGDRDVITRSSVSTWRLDSAELQRRARRGWKARCSYASPCPVTLLDITRRIERCQHDICANQARLTPAPKRE